MTKQSDIDELLNNAKNRIERPDMVFVADIFKDYETLKSLISENEQLKEIKTEPELAINNLKLEILDLKNESEMLRNNLIKLKENLLVVMKSKMFQK